MKHPKLNLHYHPTPDALALAAAEELLTLVLERKDPSLPFGIALSGGRIAERFFRAVVDTARHKEADFENVHFFWADERCVPPTDPESNYATAELHLFDPLGIDPQNIHRIEGEDDFAHAALEAEAELCYVMPLDLHGVPLLDVVILGMGEDGHVASLFPNEGPEWVNDEQTYRHVTAPKPPPNRITLGYQPIIRASNVLVLVSGEGKTPVLKQLVETKDLPIHRVVAGRDTTTIFQDSVKNL